MKIELVPIGFVRNSRTEMQDDYWGDIISVIECDPFLPAECLDGIEAFSHVEIIFYFHAADPAKIVHDAQYPRDNPAWPRVGIFAQRKKDRPNQLGLSIARIVKRKGHTLEVQGLDAIDGTPVLDIKPVLREFLPQEPVVQPEWATELMQNYWKAGKSNSSLSK